MDSFESPIDKIIREAQQAGGFENLPGKGKPLVWDDESGIPEDERMARRLLRQNHIAPEWVTLGRELDSVYERLKNERIAGKVSQDEFAAQVRKLNLHLTGYNLIAPRPKLPYPVNF